MRGDEAWVYLDFGLNGDVMIVAGIQRARDGSTTLMALTGETLKYERGRGDTRVSNWTYSEYAGFNGPYVHAYQQDAFPIVEETCESQ
jgi:hypothetical protein